MPAQVKITPRVGIMIRIIHKRNFACKEKRIFFTFNLVNNYFAVGNQEV